MTILLRKQVITGTLQISSVAGTIKVPRQGVTGVLSQSIPVNVSGAIKLPMQKITGGLDCPSILTGNIDIPRVAWAGELLHILPAEVEAAIGVPIQIVDGVLDNPPTIAADITVPMQGVVGTAHYAYVARRRTDATWWLTESTVLSHTAAADISIFAKRRLGSRWWLTQTVEAEHRLIHDVGLWARGGITAGYALRIGRNQTALWRLPVAASHGANYGCRAERVFGAGYSLRWPIRKQHVAGFSVQATDPVRRAFAVDYGIRVGAAQSASWGTPSRLRKTLAVRYAGLVPTARSHGGCFALQVGNAVTVSNVSSWNLRFGTLHTVRYESAARLAVQFIARHDVRPPIVAALSAPWVLTEVTQRTQNSAYALAQFNRAVASLRSPCDGRDLSSLIGLAIVPSLRLSNRRIDLITASIGVDEPSPWWMARFEIADHAGYGQLAVGAEVTLDFGEASFALVIDGKHLVRSSPTALRLEVTARSPLAALAPPLGPAITRSFLEALRAEDAVRALLPGITLDWLLPDWWIPAGRLAAVQSNPVEIARNIARAAGGVLDSLPDGRVVVRPLYTVSMPDYARTEVSLVLTDDDLFEAEETLDVRADINRLRISDGDNTAIADRVEFIKDQNDSRQGIVRVAASPWRALSLAHTGDAFVSILPLGDRLQEEIERVEFKAGVATLAWPVEELRSVRWQHRDLGIVTFTRGGAEIRAGGPVGYSLAEIRYAVRVLEWKVTNVHDEAIQFLVLEA